MNKYKRALIIFLCFLAIFFLPGKWTLIGAICVFALICADLVLTELKSQKVSDVGTHCKAIEKVGKTDAGNGWEIGQVDSNTVNLYLDGKFTGPLSRESINTGLVNNDPNSADFAETSRMLHTALDVINSCSGTCSCRRG
jgi:hypothetical protein